MQKEALVAYFNIVSHNLSGWAAEIHVELTDIGLRSGF
jgi:hypothetical protein